MLLLWIGHNKPDCAFKDKACSKCSMIGHTAATCRSGGSDKKEKGAKPAGDKSAGGKPADKSKGKDKEKKKPAADGGSSKQAVAAVATLMRAASLIPGASGSPQVLQLTHRILGDSTPLAASIGELRAGGFGFAWPPSDDAVLFHPGTRTAYQCFERLNTPYIRVVDKDGKQRDMVLDT